MAPAEVTAPRAIIWELWVTARQAWGLVSSELEAAGVETDDYGVLSFIGHLQPVSRARLAEAMGLRRTTLRDSVGRLIERGDVEERANPRDGRSTLLVLTPSGQETFQRARPVFSRVLDTLDRALEGQLDEHEQAVRRVRLALQALSAESA